MPFRASLMLSGSGDETVVTRKSTVYREWGMTPSNEVYNIIKIAELAMFLLRTQSSTDWMLQLETGR